MAKSIKELLLEVEMMEVTPLPPNCAEGYGFEDWLRNGAVGYSQNKIKQNTCPISIKTDNSISVNKILVNIGNGTIVTMSVINTN